MLAISVELLHGTFRGASADDTALMGGEEDSGEWPPSPARLFAALVAADGTRSRCHVTDGSELLGLERAGPPRIVADAPERVAMTQLLPRYVVVDERYVQPKTRETGAVQEYVGRAATLVRPGARRCPANPVISYVWPDLVVNDVELSGLRARAARVGYLGCADSPVRVQVSTEAFHLDDQRLWEPDAAGEALLPVPWAGLLEVLDDAYERWIGGEAVRKAWLPTELARYRPPGAPAPSGPTAETVWLRFGSPVSGRRVLAVTQALRGAVLEGYERWVAGSAQAVPQVLHGHGFPGRGFQHVHWLALPDVGRRYAGGQIYGAAVWLPPGTDAAVVAGVREVLWRLAGRDLGSRGIFETKVMPYSGDPRPWAANPKRWQEATRTWVSAFPVVQERWQPEGPDLAEVARWCRHAGISVAPIRCRWSPVPILEGAPHLRPEEVHRPGSERRPYGHLRVEFATPVKGPLALGRARQFGLGLMAPVHPARSKEAVPGAAKEGSNA
jgi:CRISPR-associated protein Csb2